MRFKVDFETMDWEPIRPDVRQKLYCEGREHAVIAGQVRGGLAT